MTQPPTDAARVPTSEEFAIARLTEMADHGRIDAAYGDFSHPTITMIADVRKLLSTRQQPEAGMEGGELRAAQDRRRRALIERLGAIADLACQQPLGGVLGDVAYDLLRQAAAQIASDRQHISRRAKRDCTCHPDDQPAGPCRQRYAASECNQADADDAFDYESALFDVLETLKARHPQIAGGFARGTGGVDLPYILSELAATRLAVPTAVGREEQITAMARAMCDRVNGQGDFDQNIEQRRTGWEAQARAGLEALLSHAEAGGVEGWRTIDSAPKDGTEFQAWCLADGAASGFWEPRCRYDDNGAFQIWGRTDYDQEGWDIYRDVVATHWMPEPASPAAVAGGGE